MVDVIEVEGRLIDTRPFRAARGCGIDDVVDAYDVDVIPPPPTGPPLPHVVVAYGPADAFIAGAAGALRGVGFVGIRLGALVLLAVGAVMLGLLYYGAYLGVTGQSL